ncbi:N-acetyltransferase family protein [Geomicrobium sp. JSM 1781026]|uniref:GNAT family N-acetyltransferase n=1 Tax=Geomicrobium sp. JSM 1781026 TaxID=3344580 RepID=UPI0035C0CB70
MLHKKTPYSIRKGKLDDSDEILQLQSSVISEDKFLITTSAEFTPNFANQKEWMNKILENDRETIIVAEFEAKVIGWIIFQSHDRKRLQHTGSFGMAVSKAHRGTGVGKALVESLLLWAEKNTYIEKISLGVFSTNHRAISLYKKIGFIEEGRKVKEIKIDNHQYIDDIMMHKFV